MAKKPSKKKRAKDIKRNLIIVGILALVIVAVTLFFNFNKSTLGPTPEVHISSSNVQQADTMLVTVKSSDDKITGQLDATPIPFFKSEDGTEWIGIAGIPVAKNPGDYPLTISNNGATVFTKTITVARRDFPTTSLSLTPGQVSQGVTPQKLITTITGKENNEFSKITASITPKAYFTKPFEWPLADIKITGAFGDIRISKQYGIQHLGVDLRATMDTSVHAVNDGKIVFEEKLPIYGNMLIVDHGLGIYSLYLHLDKFEKSVGQMVKQGDIIALSGNTGYALGPHLHFSIKVLGAALDPMIFINTTKEGW